MDIKRYREVLEKRNKTDNEDGFGLEQCWKEEAEILTKDIKSTIKFIDNEMKPEELADISEVFEDIFEFSDYNQELIDAIYRACDRFKDISDEYYVKDNLDRLLK